MVARAHRMGAVTPTNVDTLVMKARNNEKQTTFRRSFTFLVEKKMEARVVTRVQRMGAARPVNVETLVVKMRTSSF